MKLPFLTKQLFLSAQTHMLAIYAHPDDETAFSAGLLSHVGFIGGRVTLVVLTKGEKSTLRYGLHDSDNLSEVRTKELYNVAHILGVHDLIHADFADLSLTAQQEHIKVYIANLIQEKHPTVVLTLEPQGIYGHPDHIAVSGAVTEIYHEAQHTFHLLYATVSKPFLPDSGSQAMAKNGEMVRSMVPNTIYPLNFKEQIRKWQAFRSHRSQFSITPSFIWNWWRSGLFSKEFYTLIPGKDL